MPELPEVEITRSGIAPYIEGSRISKIAIRTANLRWPVAPEIEDILLGKIIAKVGRRGKYLLLHTQEGCLLIHLGMTGYLHVLQEDVALGKHDHWDICFESGVVLRFNDVRRFGYLLWVEDNPEGHHLLHDIGPEPLTLDFEGEYLFRKSRKKKVIIKQFLMDKKVVAGIGNIYANETLFHAGIRPDTPAGDLSLIACVAVAKNLKTVLTRSLDVGGTMIDFRSGLERPGHFSQQFAVYCRGGKPCLICDTPIEQKRIGLRSIYYCKTCQS